MSNPNLVRKIVSDSGSTGEVSAETILDKVNSSKNVIINGNFDFWQRGTTATRTQASNQSGYLADRVSAGISTGGSSKSVTFSRSTAVPTGLNFSATYSYEILNNTAIGSFTSSENIEPFLYKVEGNSFRDVFGKDFTIGFWLYTSFAGKFPVSVRNGTSSFTFVSVVDVSIGWQYVSLNIPWNSNITEQSTGIAVQMDLGLTGGTALNAPSLNSWIAGAYYSHSTATNWAANAGAIIRICQLQLRAGTWSSSEMQNSFQTAGSNPADEYQLCQRYYQQMKHIPATIQTSTTVAIGCPLPVPMRATPSPGQTGVLNLQGTNAYNASQSSPNLGSSFCTFDSLYITNIGNWPPTLPAVGHALFIGVPSNNNNYVYLDAEL